MSDDNELNENNTMDLHSLLSPQTIEDWGVICRHIQRHPHHARERYYRNESPLQLALTARGDSKERMDALKSLLDADPDSIHSRDAEGRTPLHTACAAGRSDDILRWLINAEDESLLRRSSHSNESEQRSVTLRTDYPGGALPLHMIAASSQNRFDCIASLARGEATDVHYRSSLPLNRYRMHCAITPNIISAYLSTTCIWQAHPEAVWDKDCEGEIPLHAAASWGNVGAIVSLLIGHAAVRQIDCSGISSAVRTAALTTDDRNKTPLDRACNRLSSICVNLRDQRPSELFNYSSLRRSIPRHDPFEDGATPVSISSNEGQLSLLPNSQMMVSCRRRIPGCGSSFHSSFSSSLVGVSSASKSSVPIHRRLNSSFIPRRKPIDPILGLEALDGDGIEEFAKVEMLARAACGFFEVFPETTPKSPSPSRPANTTVSTCKATSCFRLLHAVIVLGCAPEIVWHVAARFPHQVGEKDERGRCPFFLACDRLAVCSRRLANQHRRISSAKEAKEANKKVEFTINEDEDSGTKFVQSLLLGEKYPSVLDDAIRSTTTPPTIQRPTLPHRQIMPTRSPKVEIESGCISSSTSNDDPRECGLSSREIIDILLHSSLFGKPEMASVPDAGGRLPLHVVLEAGMQWAGEDVRICDGENEVGDSLVPQSLMDVYPRALEIMDGKTGLLPFMIAATLNDSDEESNESMNEGCTKQLQTIYLLLLKAPNAIALSL